MSLMAASIVYQFEGRETQTLWKYVSIELCVDRLVRADTFKLSTYSLFNSHITSGLFVPIKYSRALTLMSALVCWHKICSTKLDDIYMYEYTTHTYKHTRESSENESKIRTKRNVEHNTYIQMLLYNKLTSAAFIIYTLSTEVTNPHAAAQRVDDASNGTLSVQTDTH